jgi:3-deoxy-D-manno-octulosonate 8-phosphate phosphatase (KDO 8-P phosphatase)
MPTDALVRARRVRLLTCDVDGVLTDGRIYVDDHGHETKAFSALDGVGIGLLQRAGIIVAWITGSAAPAVTHRARKLNVTHVVLDASEKHAPWDALRKQFGLASGDCAHIGDDLPDLAIFHACGFAVTVPHAPPAVREHAHYVTAREGGAGAVRELADLILAAQGKHLDASRPPPRAA